MHRSLSCSRQDTLNHEKVRDVIFLAPCSLLPASFLFYGYIPNRINYYCGARIGRETKGGSKKENLLL